jgi:hypothetical protein
MDLMESSPQGKPVYTADNLAYPMRGDYIAGMGSNQVFALQAKLLACFRSNVHPLELQLELKE